MFGKTQIKNSPIYYPLLASEEINGGAMSKIEVQDVWSRFDMLSEEKKDILTSEELPLKIKTLQEKLGCDDAVTESLSVLIRWYFFGDVDDAGLRTSLSEIVDENAEAVLGYIQNEIVSIKPRSRTEVTSSETSPVKSVPSTVKLPLLQALSKYEQLGNQLITRERIKLRTQPETVRPSLLYWIKYYRDELGVGHHSTVDRGNFLFRSENGKKLSPEERERVNLVLKSVEENYPVEVDTEQSILIFPPFVLEAAPMSQVPPTPPMAPQKSAVSSQIAFQPSVPPATRPGGLTFTSNHVMPGEREAAQAPKNQAPVQPRSITPAPKSNPFHIRPVSLGKEE